MSERFVNVDRDTPMLLPVDLRDWVRADDMVHFVLEAVEGMGLSTLKVNRRGSGSPQYPPQMMTALLIYCYSQGVMSSRKIEQATYHNLAVRYLTGDTHLRSRHYLHVQRRESGGVHRGVCESTGSGP